MVAVKFHLMNYKKFLEVFIIFIHYFLGNKEYAEKDKKFFEEILKENDKNGDG
jgi:hypothetical protein